MCTHIEPNHEETSDKPTLSFYKITSLYSLKMSKSRNTRKADRNYSILKETKGTLHLNAIIVIVDLIWEQEKIFIKNIIGSFGKI